MTEEQWAEMNTWWTIGPYDWISSTSPNKLSILIGMADQYFSSSWWTIEARFTLEIRSHGENLSRAMAYSWKAGLSTWQPLDVV
jgi:hypothetical protein